MKTESIISSSSCLIIIKKLTPDLLEDYLDFFDHRAFSDGSPFYPCYCSAFNMSRERIQNEFFRQAEINGGGSDGWKKALRDSAVRMVANGEIQGYLAYDGNLAVGWCNASDRLNYCRVGEFDLSSVPPDEPCDGCQRRGQVKSVVCFEIAPEYRGKGIATLLLETVCRDARAEGYAYVEAYPVKDEGLQGLAFTGPKRLYKKAGFMVTARKGSTLVMRKPLDRIIAACGNDCSACPRYVAHPYEKTDAELLHTAELWKKIGYRDHIVTKEEISCHGCKPENWCRYRIVRCCEDKGISNCSQCECYPCDKMKECFEITKSFEPRCRQVCAEEEYNQLKKAFFEKDLNLKALQKKLNIPEREPI